MCPIFHLQSCRAKNMAQDWHGRRKTPTLSIVCQYRQQIKNAF